MRKIKLLITYKNQYPINSSLLQGIIFEDKSISFILNGVPIVWSFLTKDETIYVINMLREKYVDEIESFEVWKTKETLKVMNG